jgi:type IV pilus assembly protein PilN
MRVTLNLATRPFADIGPAIKRLRIAMGVLALLGLLLGLGLHAIYREAEAARAHDHSLDGQIAHVTQEQKTYRAMMNQPENEELLKQATALNLLIDEKAFSWTLAMEDLETVLPGGVQVTALDPARQKDGHISVKLRVVGPRNRAVDLVRNLEHSKRFLVPRIVGENAENTDKPGQRLEPVSAADRVDFDLLADYNPATPEERKATNKGVLKAAVASERAAALSHPARSLPIPPLGAGRPPHIGPQGQPTPRPTPPLMRGPGGRPAGAAPNSAPGGPR